MSWVPYPPFPNYGQPVYYPVAQGSPELELPPDLRFLFPPTPWPVSGFQALSLNGFTDPVCEERIRYVWSSNLHDEFRLIRALIKHFHYVALDTEFPGVVAHPIATFESEYVYKYEKLRTNVDLLNIIQVGLSLFDEYGNPAPGISTWQFNFKFSLAEEMYAQDSIQLLKNAGVNFQRHDIDGIEWREFSELFITSGCVLNENIKWLSFHGGYDFAYLVKLLSGNKLPESEEEFFDLLKVYFPYSYDVKFLMKSCKNLTGGLQELANKLDIPRFGYEHQAGSDSLVTGHAFFRLKQTYFENVIEDEKYNGCLHDFGCSYVHKLESQLLHRHTTDK